jgi:hypothetical protein
MNPTTRNSPIMSRGIFWRGFSLAMLLALQPLSMCRGAAATVFAWGADDSQQIDVPAGLGTVTALAAGESHSLALKSNGTVAGWGFNVYGQATPPTNLTGVTAIAARVAYSMALTTNGTVVVWGSEAAAPAGLANVTAIAAGWSHSLALKKDGTVVSWGSSSVVPAGLSNVVAIAAGNNNSLALLANGTVVAWGDDSYGKSEVPATATNVIAIAAGADHCLALLGNRTVVAWGRNDSGQATVPAGLTNVLGISAGELHSVSVETDGTIAAWGDDTYGQTSVTGLGDGFTFVVAGGYHNLALKGDGSPIILTQPASQIAGVNGRATFSVFAIGTQPFSYQWQHQGTNLIGATLPSLSLFNLTVTNSGTYVVSISNSRGAVLSQLAFLQVVEGPPLISIPPADRTVVCGQGTIFNVTAGGSTNLGYQWEYQGQPINGATRSSFLLPHVDPTNAGPYTVLVTNEFGSTATGAVLSVTLGVPQITSPLAAYGIQGQAFSYSIQGQYSPGSFGAEFLPAGLTIDTTNGIISGTPTESGGFFPVITAATTCASDSEVLLLSIGSGVPVISGPNLLSGVEDRSVSNAITASGAATLFGADNLPVGISIDPLTGIITGVPTYAGEFDSTLWASNMWGLGRANMHSSFQNELLSNLSMDNVSYQYSSPYLLDFSFSLSSLSDITDPTSAHGVVVNPQLLSAVGLEDGEFTSSEGGLVIARGSSKLLKIYLILDFTESVASLANGDSNGNGISDAVDNMVAGAISFVNQQSSDTQVGVYEFHREDEPANKVVGLTQDKTLLSQSIAGIWTNYVQGFSASSICWDATYAAVQDLGAPNADELHYAVLISDGQDESSTNTLTNVIAAATTNNVRVFTVGFGVDLVPSALQMLSSQTGGRYHTATNATDLATQFAQVGKDANSQYVLRWATLKRAPNPNSFQPGFIIGFQLVNATNPPNTTFLDTNNPVINTNTTPPTTNYNFATNFAIGPFSTVSNAGPVTVGLLRLVPVAEAGASAVTLRSAYTPRYIRQIRLHYRSNWPCTPSLQSTEPGGLLEGWDMSQSDDGSGGDWLLLSSPDPTDEATSIPFTAFGPLVTFSFQDPIDPSNAFSIFDIDNTLYTNTGGQSFIMEDTNLVFYPPLPHGTPVPWLISEGYPPGSDWVKAELLDPDHDGVPNWEEYRANTNPRDPTSKFQVRSVTRQLDGRFQVTFSTSTNRTYRVDASTDLMFWEPVADGIQGINQDVTVTDTRLIGNPGTIFYRAAVY